MKTTMRAAFEQIQVTPETAASDLVQQIVSRLDVLDRRASARKRHAKKKKKRGPRGRSPKS